METKGNILIVEDERRIRSALKDFLEYQGFEVNEAKDGLEAERTVSKSNFDIIILDLMLPKISGEQLCTRWREQGIQTPVIMLTAKGQEKEKIAGLELGADDYITKPFSLEELLARMKAILRRVDPCRGVGRRFRFGDLEIDAGGLVAKRNRSKIELSNREIRMIVCFAANPGRVISREELYKEVWGEEMSELGTRTTDMHIAKLRAKIEKDPGQPEIIRTVRGAGYKYEAD